MKINIININLTETQITFSIVTNHIFQCHLDENDPHYPFDRSIFQKNYSFPQKKKNHHFGCCILVVVL